jgi:aspartate racemase
MTGPTIGILAGSGPEAGIDMWAKVLAARRDELGTAYRGDVDAPRVIVLSEPALGLSMDLDTHEKAVWVTLETAARQLTATVDVWAIACNTLNYFAPRLVALDLGPTLITPDAAVRRFLDLNNLRTIGLLGARPVAEMGPYSPYNSLSEHFAVSAPSAPDRELLHVLIEEIKIAGSTRPAHAARLAAIVNALPVAADPVLLACTELPLVHLSSERTLVDVTDLVARELVSFR